MKLNEWVKAARTHAKLSQEKLGEALGRTKANISSLEKGRHDPSIEQLMKISRLCGFALPEEIGGANITPATVGSRRVPLVNYVQAGAMREICDQAWIGDAAEFLLTDLELSSAAFALSIKGDSMLPDFREGDRVIIDPEVRPTPGDFVVAKNGGEEATFKKYRPRGMNEHGDEIFELVPLNDDFAPMRSDVTPLLIIGTMVEHRRYRKRGGSGGI